MPIIIILIIWNKYELRWIDLIDLMPSGVFNWWRKKSAELISVMVISTY